jgi:hydrogenase maturation protease
VDFKAQPGSTRFFSLDEIKSQKQISTVSTHNADLFQIIRFGQEFDECPKKIFVYGVQPSDVSFGEGLTKQVEKRMNEMVSELTEYIRKLVETKS